MKNLTKETIVAYSSDGNFIELEPQQWSQNDPEATIYVIDDTQYQEMKNRGVSDLHLTKPTKRNQGRDGKMVQQLYTYGPKSYRVMPVGEL